MAPWAEPENPDDGLTCRIGPRQSSATSNGRAIYGKHIQNHFIGFACNRAVVLVAGSFSEERSLSRHSAFFMGEQGTTGAPRRAADRQPHRGGLGSGDYSRVSGRVGARV